MNLPAFRRGRRNENRRNQQRAMGGVPKRTHRESRTPRNAGEMHRLRRQGLRRLFARVEREI